MRNEERGTRKEEGEGEERRRSSFLTVKSFFRLLRYACSVIESHVQAAFPEHSSAVMRSFIFLRFICPSLVSPELYGLNNKELVPVTAKRNLVLISKVS